MFQVSSSAMRKSRKGLGSALAIALAGGMVLAGGGVASPAIAKQKEEKAAKTDYSKAFVEAYTPVNDALNAAADAAAATPIKAQIPAVVAAAQTADDRMAAGQLTLNAGTKLKDPALQRQGLEMMLASGKVPADRVGQYNFFVGQIAYQMEDYDAARTALEAAIANGYTENDPAALVAESYFQQQRAAEGLAYLSNIVKPKIEAGEQVPDQWVLRGLAVAYEANLPQQSADFAIMAVENNPTQRNWTAAIQVVRETNQFAAQEMLDLTRLMLETNSFDSTRDYLEYIEAADARRMPNEVVRVIDHGVAAGKLNASDISIKDANDIAKSRAAADKAETPGLVGEARSSSTGVTALGVGDSFLSFNDAANAEDMYKVALEKGGVDNQRVLTRIGIAQAKQGKYAEAKTTLGQVTGQRKPIADLWIAYADSKMAG